MTQPDTIIRTWQNIFRLGLYDYMMPANFDESIARTFALLGPAQQDHVLDVGTGSGRVIVHAAPWLHGGGNLTGFDLLPGGLERARVRARTLGVVDRVHLVQGDVLAMEKSLTGMFDGAVVHFAIYTFGRESDRCTAWTQVARRLKPSAPLVVTVPSDDYSARDLISEARDIEWRRSERSMFIKWFRCNVVYGAAEKGTKLHVEDAIRAGRFHGYSEADLRSELTDAGFEVVSMERIRGVNSFRAKAVRASRIDETSIAS